MLQTSRSDLDCCQPVSLSDAHWAEHDARLRAARAAVEASRPRACPACGAADPIPTFMESDEWECTDTRCLATWRQEQ